MRPFDPPFKLGRQRQYTGLPPVSDDLRCVSSGVVGVWCVWCVWCVVCVGMAFGVVGVGGPSL